MIRNRQRHAGAFSLFAVFLLAAVPCRAGSLFLTCHDPDFHAFVGGNTTGARNINNIAIDFVRDPAFNPFAVPGAKFLFVESKMPPPGGHVNGVNGIIASGFVDGVDFDHHDAGTLDGALDLLGIAYDAIVVASDFGGVLTQAELDILNARAADIQAFIDAGGGLYALAESNGGAGLTPAGGHYEYLGLGDISDPLNQGEVGYTVTPFGQSLGLTNADVNGNASHCFFDGPFGLEVVDVDANDRIMSLAGRTNAPPDCSAAVADPSELWPPNHKLVPIAITGVTDPDDDTVSITVDGIRQDEPVQEIGTGSGDTCPDATGVGTDTPEVRAERAGTKNVPGNGRVYHIAFTADDGKGGTCMGEVTVCVPHEQRPGSTCVDDGPLFDSTMCPSS